MTSHADSMTKEDIIACVRASKCKMMKGLPLLGMTRAQLLAHLEKSCCPVLKKLVEKK
jgi:hypothetical protein